MESKGQLRSAILTDNFTYRSNIRFASGAPIDVILIFTHMGREQLLFHTQLESNVQEDKTIALEGPLLTVCGLRGSVFELSSLR